jgi:putative ABC transport system substrate-binding protein
MIERRALIAMLGGAAVVWPHMARAQQRAIIGFLSATSDFRSLPYGVAFRDGLAAAGCLESRDYEIDYHFAANRNDLVPSMTTDLVNHRPSVIFVTGGLAAGLAVKAATTTIPIVFLFGGDPVVQGLVSSLARPEGNLTGLTFFSASLGAKKLQVLHELVPGADELAFLVSEQNTNSVQESQSLRDAAQSLGRLSDRSMPTPTTH